VPCFWHRVVQSTTIACRSFRGDPLVKIGILLLGAILLLAIFGPLILTADPLRTSSKVLVPPSLVYPLGTDQYGRDVLVRLVNAFRLDLFIAVVSVAGALLIGMAIGSVCGYIGGRLDDVMMRGIDVIQSFPMFILAMGLVAFIGVGIKNVILVTILINIPVFARLVRGDTLSKKCLEYVDAARCSGCSQVRILTRHLLPNTIGPLIVQGSLNLAWAMLNVAGLSFLGIGINPPTPDLGVMVADGAHHISQGAWWMSVYPGLALALAVFSFNVLGDGLQDRFDPRRRGI
jgi:peptide/nickel transport system permease protein